MIERGAARRHLLAERHDLARQGGDADLRVATGRRPRRTSTARQQRSCAPPPPCPPEPSPSSHRAAPRPAFAANTSVRHPPVTCGETPVSDTPVSDTCRWAPTARKESLHSDAFSAVPDTSRRPRLRVETGGTGHQPIRPPIERKRLQTPTLCGAGHLFPHPPSGTAARKNGVGHLPVGPHNTAIIAAPRLDFGCTRYLSRDSLRRPETRGTGHLVDLSSGRAKIAANRRLPGTGHLFPQGHASLIIADATIGGMLDAVELGIYTFAELTPDPATGRTISQAERLQQPGRGDRARRPGRPRRLRRRRAPPPRLRRLLAGGRARGGRRADEEHPAHERRHRPQLRRPVRVFQHFATLDLLSGGRAEIMAGPRLVHRVVPALRLRPRTTTTSSSRRSSGSCSRCATPRA